MDQAWFEMRDVRRRALTDAVWIPLRASKHVLSIGKSGYAGHQEEFFGVGTLAVPLIFRSEAGSLTWMDIGIGHQHSGYVDDDEYVPCDIYRDYRSDLEGVHLVLEQGRSSLEQRDWHLHQDFVTTLGLRRESDTWIRPDEGYIDVAKLDRAADGTPVEIIVRASHLKDYLCARKMALYVTSYRRRTEITSDEPPLSWQNNPQIENDAINRWEGHIFPIHEGGMPFGESVHVFQMARTDADPEEDVPVLGFPSSDNTSSTSWTVGNKGRRLFRAMGELWRCEWIEPSALSPIIRGDKTPPIVRFITDSVGTTESRETLDRDGRWLWFQPDVVCASAHRRGGVLKWYTRDTGSVGCSPEGAVHFGMNSIGLITVYAKDIAYLPDWEQRIWAGFNVAPEGKVSEELHASQVRCDPASTHAPEAFVASGLWKLNEVSHRVLGRGIVRQHEQANEILARTHRFRATTKEGLFSLAKDLARLTVDSFDVAPLQQMVTPPKGEKWGSLKLLEKVLATRTSDARQILTPLSGIYELRHSDAHLGGPDPSCEWPKINVNIGSPLVLQGYQMIEACVSCIHRIIRVFEEWSDDSGAAPSDSPPSIDGAQQRKS